MTTLWSFIGIVAAVQGIFIGVAMAFHPKIERLKRTYFGLLIIFFSLWLAEFSAYWSDYLVQYPHLAFTTKALPWLFGPLLFLFAKQFTKNGDVFRMRDLLHFVPFLIRLALYVPIYIRPTSEKVELLNDVIYSDTPDYSTLFFILEFVLALHMLIYLYFSKRLLSEIPDSKRSVIRALMLGVLLYLFPSMLLTINILLYDYKFLFQLGAAMLLIDSILIYSLSYLTIIKPLGLWKNEERKYRRNKLNPDTVKAIETDLLEYMEEGKNYQNKNLSLKVIAKDLGFLSNDISQVVNTKFGCHISDLINRYRVEEVKRRLTHERYRHYSIMAIAQDAGFATKASFYNAFKKIVGQTPTEYRSQHAGQ